MSWQIRKLGPDDVCTLKALSSVFGEAFHDLSSYQDHRPDDGYLRQLLAGETFIALAAVKEGEVIGGIAAYELKKFEQARSEIYLYDLAVAEQHRRQGVATAMIEELKRIASQRGAHVIFVQADTTIEDEPAIALYSKLGRRENVLHFDIAVEPGSLEPDS